MGKLIFNRIGAGSTAGFGPTFDFASGNTTQRGFYNSATAFTDASVGIKTATLSMMSSLYIYGGAVPDFATLSSTASTPLIEFPMSASGGMFNTIGIQDLGTDNVRYSYIIGGCSIATAAANSGTATWFALCCRTGFTGTFSDRATIFGTVGTPGSGVDLEINDVAIVAGGTYTSSGFQVSMPKIWTLA